MFYVYTRMIGMALIWERISRSFEQRWKGHWSWSRPEHQKRNEKGAYCTVLYNNMHIVELMKKRKLHIKSSPSLVWFRQSKPHLQLSASN